MYRLAYPKQGFLLSLGHLMKNLPFNYQKGTIVLLVFMICSSYKTPFWRKLYLGLHFYGKHRRIATAVKGGYKGINN